MTRPTTAMVLAAGLGTRMRPITEKTPKPLVEVAGKPLIDWGLDALAAAGVGTAVVNIHHLGVQLAAHLADRVEPAIVVSDESDRLMDSGGGVVKALDRLGADPFLVLNADTFWIDAGENSLDRLAAAWDDDAMDMLLLLAPPDLATGHTGGMDFLRDEDGRLTRAKGATGRDGGFIYAGAILAHPRIFEGADDAPHSLNRYFDSAIAAGRLYGLPLEGQWITVGTPDAIEPAEAAVAEAQGRA